MRNGCLNGQPVFRAHPPSRPARSSGVGLASIKHIGQNTGERRRVPTQGRRDSADARGPGSIPRWPNSVGISRPHENAFRHQLTTRDTMWAVRLKYGSACDHGRELRPPAGGNRGGSWRGTLGGESHRRGEGCAPSVDRVKRILVTSTSPFPKPGRCCGLPRESNHWAPRVLRATSSTIGVRTSIRRQWLGKEQMFQRRSP